MYINVHIACTSACANYLSLPNLCYAGESSLPGVGYTLELKRVNINKQSVRVLPKLFKKKFVLTVCKIGTEKLESNISVVKSIN